MTTGLFKITKHSRGYLQVRLPGHPRARTDGKVFLHIIALEAKLGRPLLPDENCHHINGDKTDNRPENLEVMRRGDHTRMHTSGRTPALGHRHTEETKQKLSAAGRGRKLSEEHRAKLLAAARGNKNWVGRRHTEETRAKMRQSGKEAWARRKQCLSFMS